MSETEDRSIECVECGKSAAHWPDGLCECYWCGERWMSFKFEDMTEEENKECYNKMKKYMN